MIGGVEVASYVAWGQHNAHNNGLDMIVVQPGPNVVGGAIVVTVAGQTSNADQSFQRNSGRVLVIARNGVDAADCSLATPCATIGAVVARMQPGDTVLVRGGEYPESEVWIRGDHGQSGSPG